MIGSHHWQKGRGEIVVLSRVDETRIEESDCPCPKGTSWCNIEYRHFRVADTYSAIG